MVQLSTQAHIALTSLSSDDRARVTRQLENLAGLDLEISQDAHPLEGGAGVYLVRVSPRLRMLVRRDQDTTEVIDIVTAERLELFYRAAHAAA